MDERPVTVTIGGKEISCPPMSFYCLELAWPHIRMLGRMGSAELAARTAQLQVSMAITPEEHETATENLVTATKLVEDMRADFIGQTSEALHIIASALALEPNAPSHRDLARALQPSEINGVHIAITEMMERSGLTARGVLSGEAAATTAGLTVSPNGTLSSLN